MYAKIDDRFFTNPKARRAGADGRALFLAGLCHCSAHLTDGHIRSDMLPVIAAEAEVPSSLRDRLIEAVMWVPCDVHSDCTLVVNYLDWNQSKEQVEAKREKDRERQAKSRAESQRDSLESPRNSPVQPSPLGKPSSSSVLPVDRAVIEAVADRRLKAEQAKGNVRSPARWRAKVLENLTAEIGDQVRDLTARFDEPAARLAEVIEGARPTTGLKLRTDPAPATREAEG